MKKITTYVTGAALSLLLIAAVADIFLVVDKVNIYEQKDLIAIFICLLVAYVINRFAKENKAGTVFRSTFLLSLLLILFLAAFHPTRDYFMNHLTWGLYVFKAVLISYSVSVLFGLIAVFKK